MIDALTQVFLIVLSLTIGMVMIVRAVYTLWYQHPKENPVNTSTKTITILLYLSHLSDTKNLSLCLQTLSHIHGPHADVVIIDDTHSKAAKHAIDSIVATSTNSHLIRVYRRRIHASVYSTVDQAYRRSERGELIFILKPHQGVSTQYIDSMLKSNPSQDTVIWKFIENTPLHAILGFSEILPAQLVRSMHYTKTLLRIRIHRDAILGSCVSEQTMRYLRTHMHVRVEYTDRLTVALAHTASRTTITTKDTGVIALSVMFIVIMSHAAILAASRQTVEPLFLSWVIISVGFIHAIISSNSLTYRRKLLYLYGVPVGMIVIVARQIVYLAETSLLLSRVSIRYVLRFM